jgi:hypothetical protein
MTTMRSYFCEFYKLEPSEPNKKNKNQLNQILQYDSFFFFASSFFHQFASLEIRFQSQRKPKPEVKLNVYNGNTFASQARSAERSLKIL